MKIVICYFGLIRGFKYEHVFKSHEKYLYNELAKQNIDFSVYISTYDKDYDELNIKKIPNLINCDVVSDSDMEQKLDIIKDKFICPNNYTDEIKINLLKCWKSQENLCKMIENTSFDLCILMDIGQLLFSPIDNLNNLDTNCIYYPKFASHYGYNGRMVIANYHNMIIFMDKLNYLTLQDPVLIMCTPKILQLSNNSPNLHPESVYKLYIEHKNIRVKFLNSIKFWRCRTDGSVVKDV
jgi:hypothetical protein